jgi:prepilin-type N-terminal cleavage/methylation domain-containing protein
MRVLSHSGLKKRMDSTCSISQNSVIASTAKQSHRMLRLLRCARNDAACVAQPPRSASRRASYAKGFTLIELLVALTIMAMMSMLAWRGLDTVLRSRDAAIAARDRITRMSNALEQMSADVRSATSGRSATPIVMGATGFAMQRELAQANGPSRRATVQWQFANNALIRTVQGETPEVSSTQAVLPGVRTWDVAVFVNGNWLPAAEWIKQQEERARNAGQAQAGIVAAPQLPNAGKIVALSIKLSLPEGDVTKILLGESL